ncbi:phage major capsid protein, partial [Neisseria flavescens]
PLIFGNWSDLMIAHWGVLDVIVDPYTKSTAGAVRITTLQDVDIAVRHVESFAAIKDIVAA